MLTPRNNFRLGASREELSLIRFASKISIATEHRAKTRIPLTNAQKGLSPTTSTEDEAQLLMHLLMSPTTPSSTTPSISTPILPTHTDYDLDEMKTQYGENFELSCPGLALSTRGLSLLKDEVDRSNTVSPSPMLLSPSSPRPQSLTQTFTPQQAMEKTLTTTKYSGIISTATAILYNIGSTFDFAIESRCKSWMKSVAQVVKIKESKSCNGGKEHRVLDALNLVSGCIGVVAARTSFQVLPQEKSQTSPKRQKRNNEVPEEYPSREVPREATFPIQFEAKFEVSTGHSNSPEIPVSIKTSGFIVGMFESDEDLKGVRISLDMDILFYAIEKQSRMVVRKLTERAIISSRHQAQTSHQQTSMPPPPPRNPEEFRYKVISPSPCSPKVGSMKSHTATLSKENSPNCLFPKIVSPPPRQSPSTLPHLVQIACTSFTAEQSSSSVKSSGQ